MPYPERQAGAAARRQKAIAMETFEQVVAGLERSGFRTFANRGRVGGIVTTTAVCHGGDSNMKLAIFPTGDGRWAATCWTIGCEGRVLYDMIRASAGVQGGNSPTPSPPPPRLRRQSRDTRDLARKLWRMSETIPQDPEHPARRWLAHRHLWRPGLDLPPSVRWLLGTLYHRPGDTMAGSIVAAFKVLGRAALGSVELVHVDANGEKALDATGKDEPQAKRSFGPRVAEGRRAASVIGVLKGATTVHVVEGLADALAVAARTPEPVVAVGGTGGYEKLAPDLAEFREVVIWPDRGDAGERAARLLAGLLAGRGVQVELRRTSAEDPGAAGVPFAPVDADDLAAYITDLERDGLPRWEAGRLASQIVGPPRAEPHQSPLADIPAVKGAIH